jgi:hypothetical protein
MNQLIYLIIFLALCTNLSAQNLNFNGARASSVGNAATALLDGWAYFYNPGAISFIEKSSIGINYSNQYFFQELQQQDVVYNQKMKRGVFSSAISYTGFNALSQVRIGAGYALKLSDNFSLGVQFNYFQKRYIQVGNLRQKRITTEIGGLYKVSSNWTMGVAIHDLEGFLRDKNENLSDLRLGSDFIFSDKLHLLVDGYKSFYTPFQLRMGLEYQPVKAFFFRVGVVNNPLNLAFGIGCHFSKFNFDLSSTYHTTLGWSPSISMSYAF